MSRAPRGFSALEFLFTVTLIGTLMAVFLQRVDYYRERAEKVAMEQVARDIASALRIRVAELMLASRWDEIGRLESANPVDALQLQIGNYAGAGGKAAESSVEEGRWYFDRETRELVYFPQVASNFVSRPGERPRVSWHIVVVREAPRRGAPARPLWARLELVRPYRWFESG